MAMIIDVAAGLIVLISAVISFLRGFIREVLTIAGVVGGIVAAVFAGPLFAPTVQGWFGVDPAAENIEKLFDILPMDLVANAVAYGAIFIAVVIAISVISHFTAGAVKAMGLGPVDRTLGIFFGIARAVILLGLFYLPFHLLMSEESKKDIFKGSQSFYYIEKTSSFLAGFLPSSNDVEEKVDEAEDALKGKLLEQDLLPGRERKKFITDKDALEVDPVTPPQPGANDQEGYGDAAREGLENLFEQREDNKTNNGNE